MQLIERQAVRAILISPGHEVLLMRIRNPGSGETFWICPGGGIQAGEDLITCLRRELREELGLQNFEAHHQVHRRHHTFNWKDKRISQHEVFFIVHANVFEPSITDPEEAKVLQEFRWWPLAALDSIEFPITPRSLKKIVQDYLENGPPQGQLMVEVLLD